MAENPGFPFSVPTSSPFLQLEDFHLPGFRRCIKDDVASDPRVEERLGSPFVGPQVRFAVVENESPNGGVAEGD